MRAVLERIVFVLLGAVFIAVSILMNVVGLMIMVAITLSALGVISQ